MNKVKMLACGCIVVSGMALLTGCAATQPDKKVQQIPRITRLAEKVTAPAPVHRFRKPVRDARARTLAELADECDRLADSLRTQEVSAQALTGTPPKERQTVSEGAGSLETALDRLGEAARRGDAREIRAAHVTALSAYAGTRDR